MKELAPLPAGLKWVYAKNNIPNEWTEEPRILLVDFGKDRNPRYLCVNINDEEYFLKGGISFHVCAWEHIKEISKPKKIPYTAETFPMWVVWIRNKKGKTQTKASIIKVNGDDHGYGDIVSLSIYADTQKKDAIIERYYFKDVDDYEIAGVDGVWQPFYQIQE